MYRVSILWVIMFVRCVNDAPRDWSCSTLVIPAVSVGNVGQLACDLLISTLNARRVGFLHDDSPLPVVGSDPFTSVSTDQHSHHMTTAIEVFECVDSSVVIAQQRAPLIKGKQCQFVSRLVDWIVCSQFKMVIVLTSMFAYERQDVQLSGPQQRFLISPSLESDGLGWQLREQFKWIGLEERQDTSSASSQIYMPGSGFAKRLYLRCTSAGVKMMVLLTFCDEGDNTQDACDLVTYLNTMTRWILQSNSQTLALKFPQSWQHMFGCRYDQSIFQ